MNGPTPQPLLISDLLVQAERHHGEQQIVSRRVEGDIHRTTYRALAARSRRVANALAALGVRFGDRVGTLAWNGYRHMELCHGVCGSGAVLHTLNPRLHPDQVVSIADHAEDRVLCFDLSFLPLVEAIAGRVRTIRAFVAMTDRAHMPLAGKVPNLLCYEDLLADASTDFDWPRLDENTAATLCYATGTAGDPEGVLSSHRSTLLHTQVAALPEALNASARDAFAPVAPMFDVDAWGLPHVACSVGAKLVYPGPFLDGNSLYQLFESEGVTVSAGTPAVWQGLLTHVEADDLKFRTMRRAVVCGPACPPQTLRALRQQGVRVLRGRGVGDEAREPIDGQDGSEFPARGPSTSRTPAGVAAAMRRWSTDPTPPGATGRLQSGGLSEPLDEHKLPTA